MFAHIYITCRVEYDYDTQPWMTCVMQDMHGAVYYVA